MSKIPIENTGSANIVDLEEQKRVLLERARADTDQILAELSQLDSNVETSEYTSKMEKACAGIAMLTDQIERTAYISKLAKIPIVKEHATGKNVINQVIKGYLDKMRVSSPSYEVNFPEKDAETELPVLPLKRNQDGLWVARSGLVIAKDIAPHLSESGFVWFQGALGKIDPNNPLEPWMKYSTANDIVGMVEAVVRPYDVDKDTPQAIPAPIPRYIQQVLNSTEAKKIYRDKVASVDHIVNFPYFNSEYELITEKGLNKATGVYLMEDFSDIRFMQTDEALSIIDGIIGELPHSDEASRANALAKFISPIIRFVYPTSTLFPVFATTAPSHGSGKTLENNLLMSIYNGKLDVERADTSKDSAWDKKSMDVMLAEGSLLLCYDNIDSGKTYKSSAISMRATDKTIRMRLPYGDKRFKIPNRTITCVNGNNLMTDTDLAERSVYICLQKKPYSAFTMLPAELEEYAVENRVEVLSAIASLVHNWDKQPSKYHEPLFPRMARWAGILGGIQRDTPHGEHFLQNIPKVKVEADEEYREWADIVARIVDLVGFTKEDMDRYASSGTLPERTKPFTPADIFPIGSFYSMTLHNGEYVINSTDYFDREEFNPVNFSGGENRIKHEDEKAHSGHHESQRKQKVAHYLRQKTGKICRGWELKREDGNRSDENRRPRPHYYLQLAVPASVGFADSPYYRYEDTPEGETILVIGTAQNLDRTDYKPCETHYAKFGNTSQNAEERHEDYDDEVGF